MDRTDRFAALERRAWTDLAADSGTAALTIAHVGGGTLLVCPAGTPHVNLAMGARAAVEAVRAITAHYRAAGVPRFLVELGDARVAAAAELVKYRRGMVRLARERGAVLGAAPTDLAIAAPRDHEIVPAARILCAHLGAPPALADAYPQLVRSPHWHLRIAREGDTVVAAALLYARDGAGYLMGAATLPSHRGRGAQGALIRARLALADELGAGVVVSNTGEAVPGEPQHSEHNMRRQGLVEVARYDVYTPA
ncbi:MAG: GNAT family N-acetyltransferase [Myxococcales bacterium]|nr:GNAT family N-acetyltransferase [Myxococcales bacterium]